MLFIVFMVQEHKQPYFVNAFHAFYCPRTQATIFRQCFHVLLCPQTTDNYILSMLFMLFVFQEHRQLNFVNVFHAFYAPWARTMIFYQCLHVFMLQNNFILSMLLMPFVPKHWQTTIFCQCFPCFSCSQNAANSILSMLLMLFAGFCSACAPPPLHHVAFHSETPNNIKSIDILLFLWSRSIQSVKNIDKIDLLVFFEHKKHEQTLTKYIFCVLGP